MRQRWLIFLLSITLLGLALPAGASAGPATGAFVVVLRQPIPMDPASAMPGQMALLPMLDILVETGAVRSYTPYLGINAIVVHGDASSRQLLAGWPGVVRLRDAEAAATLETSLAGRTADAPAAGTARIQGTVTGPGGGLAGISVKAYRYNNIIWVVVGTATTAANGSYDIPALASGVYKVEFSDPAGNYIPEFYDDKADLYSGNPFNLADGQVKTGIDALLAPAGRIAGALTTTGGSAVASFGAFALRLVGNEWIVAGYTSSGADGKYLIGGLPVDSYRVRFADATSPPRYLMEYYDNVADINLATPVDVVAGQTTANINASLGGYGKMTGKVTAPDGTTPLEDINVDLYRYNAASGEWEWDSFSSTDASGNYQVDGLVTRDYRVQFSDPRGQYAGEYYNDKATLEAADNVRASLGATTADINASLVPKTVSLDRPLAAGWNLVAVPLTLPDPAPRAALASLGDDLVLTYAFAGCQPASPWQVYDPARPDYLNNLTAIAAQQGLWVQAAAPVTLTITGTWPIATAISLCPGWNLIGYPSLTARPPATALASIAGKYNLVYGYDAADTADPWKKYDPVFPAGNDLTFMQPGWGYWIRMTEAATLTVPGR